MLTAEEMEPAGHVHVNTGRLWAGGVATAIINIVVGVAVISLLSGVGRVAMNTTLAACTGGLAAEFMVYFMVKKWDTAALVNGFPSVHLTLCRSWTVRVLPPFDQAKLVPSQGLTSPDLAVL